MTTAIQVSGWHGKVVPSTAWRAPVERRPCVTTAQHVGQVLAGLLMGLAVSTTLWAAPPEKVIVRVDLRKLGFRLPDSHEIVDSTDLTFLTDNMLVVAVNQDFIRPAMQLLSDKPDSTIIFLSVTTGAVVRRAEMPLEKSRGAIQAVWGEHLAAWSNDGVRICDANLRCGDAFSGEGFMFVSPQGRRMVFGGNGLSVRKVIDVPTYRQIDSIQPSAIRALGEVIPGDHALLIASDNDRLVIRKPGYQDKFIEFRDKGQSSKSRFLDDQTIIHIDFSDSSKADAVLTDLDGKPLRRYRLVDGFRVMFLPTTGGRVFGIYEYGFTFWNSVFNFLDFDDSRPPNLQHVRVFEVASGRELASFESDPRPFLITPALSPNGRYLARVSGAILEVLAVR